MHLGGQQTHVEAKATVGVTGHGASLEQLEILARHDRESARLVATRMVASKLEQRIDDAVVQGLGSPFHFSLRTAPGSLVVESHTNGIDLARLARFAGIDEGVEGRVALDTDVTFHPSGGEGRLSFGFTGVTVGEVRDAQAHAATLNHHPNCKPLVRERRDLFTSDDSGVFEITGCHLDVLVSCTAGHWETYTATDGSNYKSPVGAACSNTTWCTPDGCDSFELAARNVFAAAKTCPVNRVTAANHAPVTPAPPPDIAADAERMAMWKQTHEQQIAGHYFWAASGCGTEAIYECLKPAGVRAIPVCAPTSIGTAAPPP